MSSISIAGDTSGAVTLAAPAIAGTNTMTLLAATGNLGPKVLSTAVASTSGTSIDFTGIPSWITRITVMFNGVSTNGSSNLQAQIGAGSVTTTGYLSNANSFNATPGGAISSTGFLLSSSMNAATVYNGKFEIVNFSSNTWVMNGVLSATIASGGVSLFAGVVTLSGTLDRVRITTVAGTDTFDAGSINILYE